MNQAWEITRISTTERTFQKIIERMPRPVGILLLGADSDLKTEIYTECVQRIPHLATGYGNEVGNLHLSEAKQPLSEGRPVLFVVSGDSWRSAKRRQIVNGLRTQGAATIIGIYAEIYHKKLTIHEVTPGDFTRDRQLTHFLEHPPTPDEFDYLIIKRDRD